MRARQIGDELQEADLPGARNERLQVLRRNVAGWRHARPRSRDQLWLHFRPEPDPEFLPDHPLGLGGVLADPVRQVPVRRRERAYDVWMRRQERGAGDEERRDRILLLDQHLAAGLKLEPRDPGLDRPNCIQLPR